MDPDGDGDPDDPTVTSLPQDPDITIEKTGTFNDANNNGAADVGETISYTFTVTNTGNVTLTNVTVSDPNVTVSGGPITLNPGQSDNTTFTATYTITQSDIDSGSVTNQATASGSYTDGSGNSQTVTDTSDDPNDATNVDPDGDGEPDDPTVTSLPVNRDISVEKTGTFNDANGNGYADVGETIDYTITVTNTGSITLYNVTVTDPLTGLSQNVGTLAPGQSTQVTTTYTVTQSDIDAGEVVNQATATGQDASGTDVTDDSDDPNDTTDVDPDGDGDPDDPTHTEVPQHADITVEKTGTFNDENGNGMADVGETITYTFTVTNTGNVTLTDVTIDDPLVDVDGGPITLAPGQSDSTTFTATYTITAQDLEAGQVVNQATASGDYTDNSGNPQTVEDTSDDPNDLTDVDPDGDGDPDDPTVVETIGIVINEVLTPNGDGDNDTWIVTGITHFDNKVEIYNRWGNLVYKVTNYRNDWDGKANVSLVVKQGQTLPAGTYYYIIDMGKYGKQAGYLYLNR